MTGRGKKSIQAGGKKKAPIAHKGSERAPAVAAPVATFEDDDMYLEPIKKVIQTSASSSGLLANTAPKCAANLGEKSRPNQRVFRCRCHRKSILRYAAA